MKQIIFLFVFGLSAIYSNACEINAGRLGYIKNQNEYSIFLARQPFNTCFWPDSTQIKVSVTCKETGLTKSFDFQPYDTLKIEVEGEVIVGCNVKFFGYKVGSANASPLCLAESDAGCYDVVPEISTELPPPPPFEPIVYVQGGQVVSNTPGILVAVDMQTQQAQIHEFPSEFTWEIPLGYNLVYVILPDGEIVNLGVLMWGV